MGRNREVEDILDLATEQGFHVIPLHGSQAWRITSANPALGHVVLHQGDGFQTIANRMADLKRIGMKFATNHTKPKIKEPQTMPTPSNVKELPKAIAAPRSLADSIISAKAKLHEAIDALVEVEVCLIQIEDGADKFNQLRTLLKGVF